MVENSPPSIYHQRGKLIHFVALKGLENGKVEEIVFIEVKSFLLSFDC